MSTTTLNNQAPISNDLALDFPALQLARTGRAVRFVGRLTFVMLIFVLFSMFLVPWRQTARGTGIVLALDPQQRPQPVRSPAKGVISEVKPGLSEGSFVTEGEVLLKIAPYASDGVQLLDSQILAVEGKRTNAEMNVSLSTQAVEMQRLSGDSMLTSLRESLEAAQKKYEQTQNEVASLEADLSDKKNKLRIAERVVEEGLISREELFSKQQAVEAAKAKVLKAENTVSEFASTLEAKKKEIEAKRQEIEIKNQAAEQKLNDARQKLETIKKELYILGTKRGEFRRNEISAPCSGVIQQWYGVAGSDTVKEGDQLFLIVPQAEDLAVEMKVNGNDMPLIHEGDRVRLQFEGWPAVQFVGWPSVAVGTFGGRVNRVFPTDDGKGNFRVLVSPEPDSDWPGENYLRQGVRANGWVMLKQVPLGYEIWRQLNGFPPTVSDDEPLKGLDKKAGKVKLPKT